MEKIQANVCFDVVFLYENIRTCLFTCSPVISPFSAHFHPPHYIIMVKACTKRVIHVVYYNWGVGYGCCHGNRLNVNGICKSVSTEENNSASYENCDKNVLKCSLIGIVCDSAGLKGPWLSFVQAVSVQPLCPCYCKGSA